MRTTASSFLIALVLFTLACNGRTQPGAPTPTPTSAPAAPPTKTLVIEKVVVDETPQSGTWLMCFMANAEGGSSATFNVPNRTYSGDGITIDMNIEIPNVTDGQKISFRKYLDDDQADVCGNAAEDKSNGEFRVSSSGSQHYSFDNWEYTVFWRTK
ncbi:MAG TPA: hypothetical protein VJM50_08025 [Pyrinomonadaceae bacterium]|nr:hypothetical protein [Pyrinomonadaceae bacterium]